MGKINIDKYFKKRLSSYSEDVDTDAIWKELDLEEKKDRGFIFWLFGSMSILALLTIAYFSFLAPLKVTTNPTSENTYVDNQNTNDLKQDFKISSTTGDDESDNVSNNEGNNEKTIAQRNALKQKSKSATSNKPRPESTQLAFSPIVKSERFSQARKTNFSSTAITHNPYEKVGSSSNKRTNLSKETKSKATLSHRLFNLATIDALNIELLDDASRIDHFKNELEQITVNSLGKHKFSPLQFDFYSSYNLASRRLTTAFPNDYNDFIQLKNESETILDAISLGASIKYNLPLGLYGKLGIEALNITERFNHTLESIELVTIDEFTSGSRLLTSRWVHFNNHQLLSLPLAIGYEKHNGPWSYFIEGGFHLNLLYRFKGLQLDAEGNVTEEAVLIDGEEIADRRSRHSYVISGGVRYQLAPRANIYLQPRFQSTFNTNRISAPISQNYNLYGIQLGLTYSLK